MLTLDMLGLYGVIAVTSASIGMMVGKTVWKNTLRKRWAIQIEAEYERDVDWIVQSKHLKQEEQVRLLGHLDMKRRIAEIYHEGTAFERAGDWDYGGKEKMESRYIQDRRFERWGIVRALACIFMPSMGLAMGVGSVVNHTADVAISIGAASLFVGGLGVQAWRRLKQGTPRTRKTLSRQEDVDVLLSTKRSEQTRYGWRFVRSDTYLEKFTFGNMMMFIIMTMLLWSACIYTDDTAKGFFPSSILTLGLLLPSMLNSIVSKKDRKNLRRNPSKHTMRGFLHPQEVAALKRIAPFLKTLPVWGGEASPKEGIQMLSEWLDMEVEDVSGLGIDMLRLYDVTLKMSEFDERWGSFPRIRGNETWPPEKESEYEAILKELRQAAERMPYAQGGVSQERRRVEQSIAILKDLLAREDLDEQVRLHAEVTLEEGRRRLVDETVRKGEWSSELKAMEQESIIDTVQRSLDAEGWTGIQPRKKTLTDRKKEEVLR